jgi:hypothetical protein
MYCGSCGSEIKEDVMFCGRCGSAVSKNKINPEIIIVSEDARNTDYVASVKNQSVSENNSDLGDVSLEKLEKELRNLWNSLLAALFFPALVAYRYGVVTRSSADMDTDPIVEFVLIAVIGALVYYFSVRRKSYVATLAMAIILSILTLLGLFSFHEQPYAQNNWADWSAEASVPLAIMILLIMGKEIKLAQKTIGI